MMDEQPKKCTLPQEDSLEEKEMKEIYKPSSKLPTSPKFP